MTDSNNNASLKKVSFLLLWLSIISALRLHQNISTRGINVSIGGFAAFIPDLSITKLLITNLDLTTYHSGRISIFPETASGKRLSLSYVFKIITVMGFIILYMRSRIKTQNKENMVEISGRA
jgi:hypothetical protein